METLLRIFWQVKNKTKFKAPLLILLKALIYEFYKEQITQRLTDAKKHDK